MSNYMHNKQFETSGFVCDINTMRMTQTKFIVAVTNDSHCTVSVMPEEKLGFPVQYSIDFTKILKELEG